MYMSVELLPSQARSLRWGLTLHIRSPRSETPPDGGGGGGEARQSPKQGQATESRRKASEYLISPGRAALLSGPWVPIRPQGLCTQLPASAPGHLPLGGGVGMS